MENVHGAYEQEQILKIEEWEAAPPSSLAKALGFFAAPLTWAARKVIPESAVEKALNMAFDAAGAVSSTDDLFRDSRNLGFEASSVKEFAKAPLHVCDGLAAGVMKWAKGLAAAEGAVTGMSGLPGLTLDIPALIVLAIRTIRKTGSCYGVDTSDETERTFILLALSAGAANSKDEKAQAISEADRISRTFAKGSDQLELLTPGGILGKEAFTAAVRNLAKQLCINITRRKAAQAIPLIGGGVGAAMNALFIADVGEAAQRFFQKRRLLFGTVDATKVPASR